MRWAWLLVSIASVAAGIALGAWVFTAVTG